jgi:hypothetical protein
VLSVTLEFKLPKDLSQAEREDSAHYDFRKMTIRESSDFVGMNPTRVTTVRYDLNEGETRDPSKRAWLEGSRRIDTASLEELYYKRSGEEMIQGRFNLRGLPREIIKNNFFFRNGTDKIYRDGEFIFKEYDLRGNNIEVISYLYSLELKKDVDPGVVSNLGDLKRMDVVFREKHHFQKNNFDSEGNSGYDHNEFHEINERQGIERGFGVDAASLASFKTAVGVPGEENEIRHQLISGTDEFKREFNFKGEAAWGLIYNFGLTLDEEDNEILAYSDGQLITKIFYRNGLVAEKEVVNFLYDSIQYPETRLIDRINHPDWDDERRNYTSYEIHRYKYDYFDRKIEEKQEHYLLRKDESGNPLDGKDDRYDFKRDEFEHRYGMLQFYEYNSHDMETESVSLEYFVDPVLRREGYTSKTVKRSVYSEEDPERLVEVTTDRFLIHAFSTWAIPATRNRRRVTGNSSRSSLPGWTRARNFSPRWSERPRKTTGSFPRDRTFPV